MIDKQLLLQLASPEYPVAISGLSLHLDLPNEKGIEIYTKRPYVHPLAFNRYKDDGYNKPQMLCRIRDCKIFIHKRNRFTCNSEHSKLFQKEYRHYYWPQIRHDIFVRDNYICKNCGTSYKGYNAGSLECDHIIPFAFVELKYEMMPAAEKIVRFLFNKENLRTLCPTCHRKATSDFLYCWRKTNRNRTLDTDHRDVVITEFIAK